MPSARITTTSEPQRSRAYRPQWQDPDQPRKMRKLQSIGTRIAPGRLKGTKLEEEIIELHLFKKWSAKRVVDHLDNCMVTESTVYGVASRFRKRMRKLDEEATRVRDRILKGMEAAKEPDAEKHFPIPKIPKKPRKEASGERESEASPQPEGKDNSLDRIATEEVFGLAAVDPDSVAIADKGEDPASLRRRHKDFLSVQAETALRITENAGRAALTSTEAAESSEDCLRWIRAYQTSIESFKGLAGLDEGSKLSHTGWHLHAHLHQGITNPFERA